MLLGAHMVTGHFLGTQIVNGHLYSRYLCYWTFIFQVPLLLDTYIPGSYVTGHIYSWYLCYWTLIFQVAMLLDIYIPGTYMLLDILGTCKSDCRRLIIWID